MALTVGTNAYGDLGGAVVYFLDTLRNARWSAITATTQSAALIDATRYLDRLEWVGAKAVSSQPLDWPRSGVPDVDSDAVPTPIIEATYELALLLAEDPNLINNINDQTGTNTKRVKADTVEVEFFQKTIGSKLPAWIQAAIGKWTTGASGLGLGFVSGATDTSSFETGAEKFGRIKGFY